MSVSLEWWRTSSNTHEFVAPADSGIEFAVGKNGGISSLFSSLYMAWAVCICFKLLMQLISDALSFALDKAGSNIPARIAIIAITTNSSMSVNPLSCFADILSDHTLL